MSRAPAVDYAVQIIELFSKKDDIGIADISNELDINKNAVTRVLEALVEKNWIYMSDTVAKKYRLTLRPFSMLSGQICNNNLVKIATPHLRDLNQNLGDSVYLGVKNGNNVLYLLHYDSTKEVKINGSVGGEYPLNCAAPGKVLLSYSNEKEIKNYFNLPIDKRTENTITEFEDFIAEVDKIKTSGYAIDNEEFAKGIICIAVPIFDYTGNVVATIGVSSLTLYDDIDSLINEKLDLIRNASAEISANLGYCGKEFVIYE